MKKGTAKKGVPALVKVISVLNLIAGIILIIFGIFAVFFVNSSFYENYAGLVFGSLGGLLMETLYFVIIFFIALGIFSVFMGRGLWKGRNWARIAQIVLALIWAVLALPEIATKPFGNTVSLIINLLIAYYLLFNLQVKAAFLK